MTQQLLFSIIIPAYNYANVLPRAITSVLQQNGNDWELIVVNDGSTDNTSAVINNFTQNTKRVSAIEQENSGPAATRNKGISASCGQYLIFLDADDEMAEGALDNFRVAIRSQPDAGIIIGGHESIYPSGKSKLHIPKFNTQSKTGNFKAYLIDKKLAISNGPTAMRRDIFSRYMYPEAFRCSEDIPIFAYALANYQATTINKSLAKVHKHNDSLRHNTEFNKDTGSHLVEEIFSGNRIPKGCQRFKSTYSGQRSLSLFRTFFLAKEFEMARKHYLDAIKASPKLIFKISYLRKYLKTFIGR